MKSSVYFGSNRERSDAYAMTDGVTDEQFEAALAEAGAEGDLEMLLLRVIVDATGRVPNEILRTIAES